MNTDVDMDADTNTDLEALSINFPINKSDFNITWIGGKMTITVQSTAHLTCWIGLFVKVKSLVLWMLKNCESTVIHSWSQHLWRKLWSDTVLSWGCRQSWVFSVKLCPTFKANRSSWSLKGWNFLWSILCMHIYFGISQGSSSSLAFK